MSRCTRSSRRSSQGTSSHSDSLRSASANRGISRTADGYPHPVTRSVVDAFRPQPRPLVRVRQYRGDGWLSSKPFKENRCLRCNRTCEDNDAENWRDTMARRRSLTACLAATATAVLAGAGTIVAVQGQTADGQSPSFEVASVKPNKSGAMGVRLFFQPGGRFTAENVTLQFLIGAAYGD